MNNLNEFRRVLKDRAASVDDHLAPVQPAAVHRRIAAVRRRRTAAAGALAAAVVVAGSAVVLPRLGGDEGPEPTSLVGVDVPETIDSLGFTYELVDTVSGQGRRVVLDLPASDRTRLVSWATSGEDDRVTLAGDLVGDPWSTDAADFSDFTLVAAGDGGRLTIDAAAGTPGIAVYEVTDQDRPEGYTRDGITFREQFAGGHLLAAVVGEPGQSQIDLPATADGPGVAVKLFCIGGPEAADTVLDLGGRPAVTAGGGCADRAPLDPAAHGGSQFPSSAGEDVSVRLEIRSGGVPVVDDDMVVAVGIYSLDAYAPAPPGPAPTTLEHDGRVWGLVHVADSSRADQVEEIAPEGRGEILAVVTAGTGERFLDVSFGDRPGVMISAGERASLQQVVSAGDAVRVRPVGRKALGEVRVSFYERIG